MDSKRASLAWSKSVDPWLKPAGRFLHRRQFGAPWRTRCETGPGASHPGLTHLTVNGACWMRNNQKRPGSPGHLPLAGPKGTVIAESWARLASVPRRCRALRGALHGFAAGLLGAAVMAIVGWLMSGSLDPVAWGSIAAIPPAMAIGVARMWVRLPELGGPVGNQRSAAKPESEE